jgi:hypothetical protein
MDWSPALPPVLKSQPRARPFVPAAEFAERLGPGLAAGSKWIPPCRIATPSADYLPKGSSLNRCLEPTVPTIAAVPRNQARPQRSVSSLLKRLRGVELAWRKNPQNFHRRRSIVLDSYGFELIWSLRRQQISEADAAPDGANQRRTTNHSSNATAVCTIDEGVPEGTLRQCC